MKRPFIVRKPDFGMTGFTRRCFLRALGAGLCAAGGQEVFGGIPFWRGNVSSLAVEEQQAPALFELVRPEKSGISWQHVNGRSPEYYLPETTGAGVAGRGVGVGDGVTARVGVAVAGGVGG